jgi:hypothetical protein
MIYKSSRREFLGSAMAIAGGALLAGRGVAWGEELTKDWLTRWEKHIVDSARRRYCDTEMGEELGWLVSPFLNGFYYGYLATQNPQWVDRLVDWADAWTRRGVKGPDGYIGWPKAAGASTSVVPDFVTDNMLGEAMALRPMVLMASVIAKTPTLKEKYGRKAEGYLRLAEEVFSKWDARWCWREVKVGGVWVVPTFGVEPKTGKWTEGYEKRKVDGFSMPANKQNHIAQWMAAMHEATGKAVYRERAEKWWQQMKLRMRVREGKYYVWNYWDPAGPWDYKSDGSTKHWVGVHPNGGYYAIDVEGMVAAFERGWVFGQKEIDRLIDTNRNFMWNGRIEGAKFQRIDGGESDKRWENAAGVLWTALVRHDPILLKIFETNHEPASWGGLSATPRHLAWRAGKASNHVQTI